MMAGDFLILFFSFYFTKLEVIKYRIRTSNLISDKKQKEEGQNGGFEKYGHRLLNNTS
jgi:hypothetical protein